MFVKVTNNGNSKTCISVNIGSMISKMMTQCHRNSWTYYKNIYVLFNVIKAFQWGVERKESKRSYPLVPMFQVCK